MAENSKDELNNKREQSKVEKEINNVLSSREKAYKESVRSAGDALDLSRQITEDIKDQLGMTRAKAEADTGALSLSRKLQQSAQAVTSELGNQGKIQRQIINDQNLLSSIRTEISNIDRQIGAEGADAAAEIAQALFEQQDKQKEIEETRAAMASMDDDSRKYHQEHLDFLIEEVNELDNQIKSAEELAGTFNRSDVRRLVQLKQQETLGEKLLEQRNAELDLQRQIEDHTGVTGALVEGVGGIMQRLGMRSGIFQNAMSLAAEDMKNMSEETIRTRKAIEEAEEAMEGLTKGSAEYVEAQKKLDIAKQGKEFDKVQIAIAGATQLSKGFGKALLDPLTIVLAIVDGFFKVDKAATDLQQLTGQNSNTLAGFNSRLASSVDVLEVMVDLTKQTGMNAQNIFSPEVLAGAAELKNTLGLAGDEAGGLAMIAQTTGRSIDDVTASIVDTTSAFNGANRSAVSQGQIIRDVAKASDGVKASLAGNPAAIAKAASAARKLGMELSQVDSIASSLMDFESSIEAELEAQLLTGKNINMSKARELALNNDLAGLGKELFKNSASLAEFGKMNRIQQEAQAKALGMTRDQLGKIAYQRALETNMTKEQAAAAAGVKLEDMERMAVQDKLAKAADKLAQAFAPMLDILIPIADLVGFIAKYIVLPISSLFKLIDLIKEGEENTSGFKNVLAGIVKLLAGGTILLVLKSLKDAFKTGGIKNYFSVLKGNFKDVGKIAGGFKDKIKEAFTGKAGKLADEVKTKAKDKLGGVAETAKDKLTKSSKKMPKGGGAASKGSSSLTDSIQKIDAKKLLAGAAAMAIAAGAVFIFAKATQEFMKVTWGAVGKAIVSLVALVGAIAALGLIMSSGVGAVAILAGAAAMVIMAGALYILGKAMQEIGTGLEKIGDSVSGELITNLFTLGPALASAAKGLALFGGAMALGGIGALIGGGMITQLQTLAGLSSPLSTVGSSLTAIAAGITAIALALSTLETEKLDEIKDLVMTTALAAPMVAASGAITSLINGITGGGEGDSNSELLAEIKALRAVVEKGGNINMDGNKVGQYIMLSANKSV